MEGHVTRRRAGAGDDVRRIAWHQLASGGVEPVEEDAIEPLVRHHDVAAGAIERTVVRMRALLLRPVRTGLAFRRRQVCDRAKRPTLIDWKKREAPGRVICEHEKAIGAIDRQVHAVGTGGWLSIQYAE